MTGCKENQPIENAVIPKQVVKNEDSTDLPIIQKKSMNVDDNEATENLSSNEKEKVYENEHVILYKNSIDTDYKDILDSPYGDMYATIKWTLSNRLSEDDFGEVTLSKAEDIIAYVDRKDINNSIVWMSNNRLLIEGHLLYNTESKESVEIYSEDNTHQLEDFSINLNTEQSVLLIRNEWSSLSVIVIDIARQSVINTYHFPIPDPVGEMIQYRIAYIDDENILFNGYGDNNYPAIIQLNLTSGKTETYSDDLLLESEYFNEDDHVIVFQHSSRPLILNLNQDKTIEEGMVIPSDKWYLKEDCMVYMDNNKCYTFSYDTNEINELFDLEELGIDRDHTNRLQFCMRHNDLGLFIRQKTAKDDSEEEAYMDIKGINYILNINY